MQIADDVPDALLAGGTERRTISELGGITGDVHVVLRNDDYTTRDFVCGLLTGTFGYTEDAAETRMMQVHTEGRGVVKRLSATEARSQIARARELARSHGFPLWIGAEPT